MISNEEAKQGLITYKENFLTSVKDEIANTITMQVLENGFTSFNTPLYPYTSDLLEINKYNKLSNSDVESIVNEIKQVVYHVDIQYDNFNKLIYFVISVVF